MCEATITREQVEQAIGDLFTTGGHEAERLVMTSKDDRDLGGWCRGAAVDRVCEQLGLETFLQKVSSSIDECMLHEFECVSDPREELVLAVTNLREALESLQADDKADPVYEMMSNAASEHPWSVLFDLIFALGARAMAGHLSNLVFDAGLKTGDVFELIELYQQATD